MHEALPYIAPAAVVLLAITALVRAQRNLKAEPRSVTTLLPDLKLPDDEPLTMLIESDGAEYPIPYHMDLQRHTHDGFALPGEFWQRYTDLVLMDGIGQTHETVNLGHDETLRSQRDHLLPAGPEAPTMGQGIARGVFTGHEELPANLQHAHICVIECFDKGGLRVLYPASAREVPTEGWYVRNVLRHVKDDEVSVRFTYHKQDGTLVADSAWHKVAHSQHLHGTDIARSLWPAWGQVEASNCQVTWSEAELLPLLGRVTRRDAALRALRLTSGGASPSMV